jgi:hypothetical protein
MPGLMSTDDAAAAIAAGLKSPSFEITFPKSFTYKMKLMKLLPYSLYFRLVRRLVSGGKRQSVGARAAPHPAE